MKKMDAVARAGAVVVLMVLALVPMGCVALRPAPVGVPANAPAEMKLLADPATRLQGYQKVFNPPPPVLKIGQSLIVASKGAFSGKDSIQFTFLGIDPRNLRLNTYPPAGGLSLFDVMLHDNVMTVVFYKSGKFRGAVFQGEVMDGGSPFGRHFGFEPADLISIFEIGQMIAAGGFEEKGSARRPALAPQNEKPLAPVKIELDRASGLPRGAVWRRPIDAKHWWQRKSARIDVTYKQWDMFTDEGAADQPARLLPRALRISSDHPRITLDVEIKAGYVFSPTIPSKAFVIAPSVIEQNYPLYPLEDMDRFLSQL
ncbi:hypothetical protein LLG95_02885 [bacterium]|nr:hypothetical protein [bacterium]